MHARHLPRTHPAAGCSQHSPLHPHTTRFNQPGCEYAANESWRWLSFKDGGGAHLDILPALAGEGVVADLVVEAAHLARNLHGWFGGGRAAASRLVGTAAQRRCVSESMVQCWSVHQQHRLLARPAGGSSQRERAACFWPRVLPHVEARGNLAPYLPGCTAVPKKKMDGCIAAIAIAPLNHWDSGSQGAPTCWALSRL